MPNKPDPRQQIRHYHERTKHRLDAYARSLGYLDWATQPKPFRQFEGAPQLQLDFPTLSDESRYDALFSADIQPNEVNRKTISQLLYDSLALSAWKEAPPGNRWSLRVNPSSGDLHPTEGYLISGPIAGMSTQPAVYHYAPLEHVLEQRVVLTHNEWSQIAQQLPEEGLLIALTSIYWRESWKYGERAFRYCHHDIGHAIGTFAFAGATLGWQTRLVSNLPDNELEILLGCHRQSGVEAEHPEGLLVIYPSNVLDNRVPSIRLPNLLLNRLTSADFSGSPNQLSLDHHAWPIINEVAEATRYRGENLESDPALPHPGEKLRKQCREGLARRLIHQRRSAVAMDGKTRLSLAQFYHMMLRVSPICTPFPYQVLPWRSRVSLALLVHRVNDMTPGIYALIRHPSHYDALQKAMNPEFLWQKPKSCPKSLALYLLQPGDAREAAKVISCHQDIAADGVFTLGMLAEFDKSLNQGAWFYPRLFWEAGLIGQVLYLEAEAAGIRATGIGCFFDDTMHQLLDITDHPWQSLYHFTIGGAVNDPRIRTLHPYFHKGKK